MLMRLAVFLQALTSNTTTSSSASNRNSNLSPSQTHWQSVSLVLSSILRVTRCRSKYKLRWPLQLLCKKVSQHKHRCQLQRALMAPLLTVTLMSMRATTLRAE